MTMHAHGSNVLLAKNIPLEVILDMDMYKRWNDKITHSFVIQNILNISTLQDPAI